MKIIRCPLCDKKLEKFGKLGIKYNCPTCSFQILRMIEDEEDEEDDETRGKKN
jgi:phage FluMu protein Com